VRHSQADEITPTIPFDRPAAGTLPACASADGRFDPHDGSPDRVCHPVRIVSGAAGYVDVPHRSRPGLYPCMTTPPTPTDNSTRHDPMRPLLVDIAQAAAILAISRASIYQLIWNDQLTPVRLGRSVRFSIKQLEQFVADRVSESAL